MMVVVVDDDYEFRQMHLQILSLKVDFSCCLLGLEMENYLVDFVAVVVVVEEIEIEEM